MKICNISSNFPVNLIFIILFYLCNVFLFNNEKAIRKNVKIFDRNIFIPYTPENPPNIHIFFNKQLLIYRAVEDIRFNRIRILGAMNIDVNKSSIIVKVNNKQIKYDIEVLGLLIKYNNQFTLKYINLVFEKIQINNITVNNRKIEYTPINKIQYKYDFTVCITSIRNNFTAKTIVDQVLNIYKKEGVSHAVIYYGDISKEVYDVLDKHVKSGFLEIYYWPELEILSYIRNYGQILKMNDCFYRSYYNSKYIVNSDIDEIIMPKKYKTLPKLINYYEKSHRKCELFYFMNKIFPITNEIDYKTKQFRYSYKNLTPLVDVNLFDFRISCNAIFESHKYVVKTDTVICLRVHEVVGLEEENQKCTVKEKDGYSRHTRDVTEYHRNRCVRKEIDNTILNYL